MEGLNNRELHNKLEVVGLKSQATAAGLLQLCAELVKADCLSMAAVGRIKSAIAQDINLAKPLHMSNEEFADWVEARLSDIFGSVLTQTPSVGASAPPLDR